MAKKPKGKFSEGGISRSVIGSARLIWLAGVGAFAKAEAEGSRLFEALVEEGEAVEARTKGVAEEEMAKTKTKGSDSLEKLEEMFKDRVSRVLNQLGVPTYSDIQNLSKQVELLDKSIKELTAARKRGSTGKRAART